MIKKQDIASFMPNDNLEIWDVRDADKYRQGHIQYAKNYPIESLNQALLDGTDGKIYVLCGGGTKAEKACELLESMDSSRTYIHLTGGTRGAMALGWEMVVEEIEY